MQCSNMDERCLKTTGDPKKRIVFPAVEHTAVSLTEGPG